MTLAFNNGKANARNGHAKRNCSEKSLTSAQRREYEEKVRTIPVTQQYCIVADYFRAVTRRQNEAIDANRGIPIAYFLSHYHADHYGGLSTRWSSSIGGAAGDAPLQLICSAFTRDCIVHAKGDKMKQFIRVVRPGEQFSILLPGSPSTPVRCEALPARHTPGSLMLRMELPDGRHVLFTGDFRCPLPSLPRPLTHLYVDTTFTPAVQGGGRFPTQDDVLCEMQTAMHGITADHGQCLFFVKTYTIGKEKVALAAAAALNQSHIHVADDELKAAAIRAAVAELEADAAAGRPPPAWLCGRPPATPGNCPDSAVWVAGFPSERGARGGSVLEREAEVLSAGLVGSGCPWSALISLEGSGWNFAPRCWTRQPGKRLQALAWGPLKAMGVLKFGYSEHCSSAELASFVRAATESGTGVVYTLASSPSAALAIDSAIRSC